jgi:hypothetical protein
VTGALRLRRAKAAELGAELGGSCSILDEYEPWRERGEEVSQGKGEGGCTGERGGVIGAVSE